VIIPVQAGVEMDETEIVIFRYTITIAARTRQAVLA
jgi:hypothetical protein